MGRAGSGGRWQAQVVRTGRQGKGWLNFPSGQQSQTPPFPGDWPNHIPWGISPLLPPLPLETALSPLSPDPGLAG